MTVEWIKITDRLPTDNRQYLVTNGAAIIITGHLGSGNFYGIGGATHWMELPEFPNKQK